MTENFLSDSIGSRFDLRRQISKFVWIKHQQICDDDGFERENIYAALYFIYGHLGIGDNS